MILREPYEYFVIEIGEYICSTKANPRFLVDSAGVQLFISNVGDMVSSCRKTSFVKSIPIKPYNPITPVPSSQFVMLSLDL